MKAKVDNTKNEAIMPTTATREVAAAATADAATLVVDSTKASTPRRKLELEAQLEAHVVCPSAQKDDTHEETIVHQDQKSITRQEVSFMQQSHFVIESVQSY